MTFHKLWETYHVQTNNTVLSYFKQLDDQTELPSPIQYGHNLGSPSQVTILSSGLNLSQLLLAILDENYIYIIWTLCKRD